MRALRDIAYARDCETQMGSEDSAYRFGADEFVILFRDISKSEVHQKAERLRVEIEQASLGDPAVTISAGLACYPVDANSKKDLLKAVDDAIYMSKRSGRNRVSLSKTFEERHAPPIIIDPGWDHPHPAKLDPAPPDLSAGNAKKLEE